MKAHIIATAKKETIPFGLAGKTYELSLTLNVINELQKKFGDLEKAADRLSDLDSLLWIFKTLINDAVDNHNDDSDDKWGYVDERYIGRKITKDMLPEMTDTFIECFGISLPDSEDTKGSEMPDDLKALVDDIEEDDDAKN